MTGFESGKMLKVPTLLNGGWFIREGSWLWRGEKGDRESKTGVSEVRRPNFLLCGPSSLCDNVCGVWGMVHVGIVCMHVCMCACVRVCAQDVGNVVGILVYQGGSDVMFATSHVPQQLPAQLGWGVGCELAVRAGPTSGLVPCSSLPRLDHIGLWSESLNLFRWAWAKGW